MTRAPYDPRYESARATCQSRRGWDFTPAETEPKAVPWWPVFLAGLVIVAVAVSLIAQVKPA